MTMMFDSADKHDHHLCCSSDALCVGPSVHVVPFRLPSFMSHFQYLLQNQLVALKNES